MFREVYKKCKLSNFFLERNSENKLSLEKFVTKLKEICTFFAYLSMTKLHLNNHFLECYRSKKDYQLKFLEPHFKRFDARLVSLG